MEKPDAYIPKLIAEYTDIKLEKCTPEKTIPSLDLDSLDVVSLGIDVEEYYDIEIPNTEYDGIKTIQNFVDVVNKYLSVQTKKGE